MSRENFEQIGMSSVTIDKLLLHRSKSAVSKVKISGVIAKDVIGKGAFGIVCNKCMSCGKNGRFIEEHGKATHLLL